MKIEINGKVYTRFLSATATVAVDQLSNTFSFTSGVSKKGVLGFGIGDACTVSIDGELILTGHIEVINGSGSSKSASIEVVGRDNTGDIVDSSIGTMDDIKTEITLKAAIERVIAHIGADIDVIDDTNGAVFTKEQDLLAPESGDNAFNYLEGIARNKHCILSSNPEGAVVIQRDSGTSIDATIRNEIDGKNNNALSYSFTYDHTGRFFKYISIGNANLGLIDTIINKLADNKQVVDKNGFVKDGIIREGRQYVIASENPGAAPAQKERAEWEANIRISRSRVYSGTVSGFRNQTGEIWTPNTIIQVIDENAKINDALLVNSVTYRMDSQNGRTTDISCINKNSYSLLSKEPADQKSENPIEKAIAKAEEIIAGVVDE